MASIRKIVAELRVSGELDESSWAALKKRIFRLIFITTCFSCVSPFFVVEQVGFYYAVLLPVCFIICGVAGFRNIQRLCEFYNLGEITDAEVTWAHLSHSPNVGSYFKYKYVYMFIVNGKTYKKQHCTQGSELYKEQHPKAGDKIRVLYLTANPDKCVPYYESLNARYNLRITKEYSYLVPPQPIARKAIL